LGRSKSSVGVKGLVNHSEKKRGEGEEGGNERGSAHNKKERKEGPDGGGELAQGGKDAKNPRKTK